MMAADLDSLITSEIPEGRQNLLDSYTNLDRVAEYCENNYFQCENKRAALEETKGYTTQSLASVAYQINTLAYNFLQMLDLQSSSIREMESQINHISQTVSIHKEKVARREIGVLTTNKCSNSRQYKIIAPANPERPIKYIRKPIDYQCLDDIGHGVRTNEKNTPRQLSKRPSTTSQYGPGLGKSQYGSLGNVSQNSAGPAPTTKPPTPPQNRFPTGTLNRSKEYRAPPVVAPPQVPSNYAPNYPMGTIDRKRSLQYGTLPNPQVGMVQPQPQEGGGNSTTMPRLSSNSMRSTSGSQYSQGAPTPPPGQESQYGLTRKASSVSAGRDPNEMYGMYGLMRQTSQASTVSRQSSQYGPGEASRQSSQYGPGEASRQSSQYGTSGQYGIYQGHQGRGSTPPSQYGTGMTRPTQRPPSPPNMPTPSPPVQQSQQMQLQQQMQQQLKQQQIQQQQEALMQQRIDQAAAQQQQAQAAAQQQAQAAAQQQAQAAAQQQAQQQQQQQPQQHFGRQVSDASIYSTRSQASANSEQPTYSRQSSVASLGAPPPPSSATGSVVPQDMSLPGWVPKNYLDKVVAIYDYNADKDDELTFQEGSTIYVLKKNDDGWWEGVMDGITGLFPGNYVEQSV